MAEDSVVKIFVSSVQTSYSQPWLSLKIESSTGTGFFVEVEGEVMIMTNAHVVHAAKSIHIDIISHPMRIPATLVKISYEFDLAILKTKLTAKDLPKKIRPLRIASRVTKGDRIRVFGYPLGGSNLSITEGVINRADVSAYSKGLFGAVIQIDAAINPGNSGGPALNEKSEVVGVAFSGLIGEGVSSVGYLIPVQTVRAFINSVKNKQSSPSTLGVSITGLFNSAMRDYLGVAAEKYGAVVQWVDPYGPSRDVLKPGDVLIKYRDLYIYPSGEVDTEFVALSGERLPLHTLISLEPLGEKIPVVFMRDGMREKTNLIVGTSSPLLPVVNSHISPSYYAIGGFIWIPLSMMVMQELRERHELPTHLISEAKIRRKTISPDENIIVLAVVLPDPMTYGYDQFTRHILKSVNGTDIINLEHLRDVCTHRKNKDHLVFEFSTIEGKMVISRKDAELNTSSILREHLRTDRDYVSSKEFTESRIFKIEHFGFKKYMTIPHREEIEEWIEPYTDDKNMMRAPPHIYRKSSIVSLAFDENTPYAMALTYTLPSGSPQISEVLKTLRKSSSTLEKIRLDQLEAYPEFLFIRWVITNAKYRRMGIAHKLLHHLFYTFYEKKIRGHKLCPLVIQLEANKPGYNLYTKFGFSVVGHYKNHGVMFSVLAPL